MLIKKVKEDQIAEGEAKLQKRVSLSLIMGLCTAALFAKTTVQIHEYANGLITAESNGYMLFTDNASIIDEINTGNCNSEDYDIRLSRGDKTCGYLQFTYAPDFDVKDMTSCDAVFVGVLVPPALINVEKIESNSNDPLLLFVVNHYKKLLDDCDDYDIDSDFIYNKVLPYIPRNDIHILRNCIFAYYGYQFKSLELEQLFANCQWYHPTDASNDEILNSMSGKHTIILNTIIRYEERTDAVFATLHRINPQNWPDNETLKLIDLGTIRNYNIYITKHILEDNEINERLIIFDGKAYKGNYNGIWVNTDIRVETDGEDANTITFFTLEDSDDIDVSNGIPKRALVNGQIIEFTYE
jgi:hypothetical protein